MRKSTKPTSLKILTEHFALKKKKFSKLSIRWLAGQLKLSVPYVSRVFKGAKPLPLARVKAIGKLLDLDPMAVRQLHLAVIRESKMAEDAKEDLEVAVPATSASTDEPFNLLPTNTYWLLGEWYYLALLDLVDCVDFSDDPQWIAKKLRITVPLADRAWRRLQAGGIVEKQGGRWRKVQKKIRFPTSKIDPSIQNYHQLMLRKTAEELRARKSQSDFDRRLIIGATVSTNEASMRKANKYMEDALFQAAEILAEGSPDRVCYIAFHLLPLTDD